MDSSRELLSVTTLRCRLDESSPLSLEEASSLIDQLAEAVDAAHARGLMHGAITPDNILLLPNGKARLLGGKSSSERSGRLSRSRRARRLGLTAGPLSLSPEEVRGEEPTLSTDIWALGVLLYEALTGQPPFTSLRIGPLAEQIAEQDPEPLTGDAAAAQDVVDRALAKWPANRFISAQALANALWVVLPRSADTETAARGAAPVIPAAAATGGARTVRLGARVSLSVAPTPSETPRLQLDQVVGRPLQLSRSVSPPPSRQARHASRSPKRFLRLFRGFGEPSLHRAA